MSFTVSVGETDFAALRKENAYYVDKTKIIYELVHETNNKVSLFTRPRRFGKTLMMSMLENFFNIKKSSREIFTGLAITNNNSFCEKWMNQYPVLFISFKDIEAETYEDAYKMLKMILADLCKSLSEIEKSEVINPADREIFNRLMFKTADIDEVKNSLKILMRMLTIVYKKPVILLMDEYDVPLANASEKERDGNRFYEKMLDIIKGITSTALKDNEFLKFAVITGCLRLAKESIFTGANNFSSYSVLDKDFSEYFGFSKEEVDDILTAAGRVDKAQCIQEWYNGYIFGNSFVYCPWDVINYISALNKDKNATPKNYWKNTSHNSILLSFVKRTDFKVNGKFEILMNGGTIIQTITDELTYNSVYSSENNLWSIILMTGYVTKNDINEEGETVHLKIPNKEILSIFQDTVVKLFTETIDNSTQKLMMSAFWDCNEKQISIILSELLWKTISYNDYHEDYYHAFLAGIFVGLGYEVESNKEKGLGRPDIILKDNDNRRAIIIETKRSKNKNEINKNLDEAIHQIATKQYDKELYSYGYNEILCYGIAFFQKHAHVKLLKKSTTYE